MRTYLITGATSGLGLQVAIRLTHHGADLLILPVRDQTKGEQLRQRLRANGRIPVSTPLLDLASLKNVEAFLNGFNVSHTPLLTVYC
jgi:short-subunit dehydrogenase